ncbi:MAG: hypothetical protein ACRCZJ_09130 [Erysipelotrichaceae bacterium]
MKRWLVLCFIFISCVGCNENSQNASDLPLVFDYNLGNYQVEDSLDQTMVIVDGVSIPRPSSITLFAGDVEGRIGFVYEYGVSLQPEDNTDSLGKDPYGNEYLYVGTLTKVMDGVYTSQGQTSVSAWQPLISSVSKTIDFYVEFDATGLQLVFDKEYLGTNSPENVRYAFMQP